MFVFRFRFSFFVFRFRLRFRLRLRLRLRFFLRQFFSLECLKKRERSHQDRSFCSPKKGSVYQETKSTVEGGT